MGAVPPHLAAAHVRVFSGGPGSEGLIKEEPGKSGKKMEGGGVTVCVRPHNGNPEEGEDPKNVLSCDLRTDGWVF